MLHWLRDHLIPHDGNDHRPRLLRAEGTQIMLFTLLATQALFLAYSFIILPSSKQVAAVIVSTLIEQTNSERAVFHEQKLRTSSALTYSAQLKANDMAARGYFAHDAPDGTSPWRWFQEAGYEYRYAGENLAVNFVDSKDVTDAWMNSPTHRENLLSDKYTEVGIATAVGKYKGREAIFVVQHFGTPLVDTPMVAQGGASDANMDATAVPPSQQRVLGAATSNITPNIVEFVKKVAAQPRTVALLIELAVALLASTALMLAFFIHIRVQHPAIIANGVIIVALTIGLAMMNSIIAKGSI